MLGINVLVDQINVNEVLKLVETDPKTGLAIQKLGANDTGLKRSYLMSKTYPIIHTGISYTDPILKRLLNWSYPDTDPKSALRLPKWATTTMVKVKLVKTILSCEVETGAAYNENWGRDMTRRSRIGTMLTCTNSVKSKEERKTSSSQLINRGITQAILRVDVQSTISDAR